MSDIVEFSFEDGNVVNPNSFEAWKQTSAKKPNIISIISFKSYLEMKIAISTKEKGKALSEQEKAELSMEIDAKLAEKYGKKVEDLTTVDRLNFRAPKFQMARTHYKDGIGTIRCTSTFNGNTMVKSDVCCEKIGDPDQTVGAPIIVYPTNQNGTVNTRVLNEKEMTEFFIWKLSAKKYRSVELEYTNARTDNQFVIDLNVTLDGEAKYQKQIIKKATQAVWAKESEINPEVRTWILEQGLRLNRSVEQFLGYKMKRQDLLEKLGLAGGGDDDSQDRKPKQISTNDYKDVLT